MKTVIDYIESADESRRSILQYLHDFLVDSYGLEPKLRYGIPFYYYRSWICYLNPLKEGGVELAFTRGNELSNVEGYLIDKGRKQVMGIEYHSFTDIDQDVLELLVAEAILLDESIPYASKRKRSS